MLMRSVSSLPIGRPPVEGSHNLKVARRLAQYSLDISKIAGCVRP